MIEKVNFEKMGGLVPAVVQDAGNGMVLMLGFMDREALRRTLEERQVVFWSRTRSTLWKKGETTGHYLNVRSIELDCDRDSLLILADPAGPVCHTGADSCFTPGSKPFGEATLPRLVAIIEERKARPREGSYTSALFAEGIGKIAQKVGEEAVELAIAAQYPDTRRCVEETADLIYHTLVLLMEKEIRLSTVLRELEERMKV